MQPPSSRHAGLDPASTTLTYNPKGQHEQVSTAQGPRRYTWNALGRLTQVSQGDHAELLLARYAYDHRGLRTTKTVSGSGSANTTTHTLYNESRQPLAEVNAQGHITRQYIWLADMLLAVMDSDSGLTPASANETADTANGQALAQEVPLSQDLWALVVSWGQVMGSAVTDPSWQLTFIHTNHLGAPELATNAQGQPVWAADYAPFGEATVRTFALGKASEKTSTGTGRGTGAGTAPRSFTLHIRLPGQMFDAETGLHYNRQRYYDPERGQYLSPDPLGQPDGPNAYLYAAGNPLSFIDPDGLILFAFDGTGNDESNANELSNVVAFRNLYDSGDAYYITGPGTLDPRSGIENPWYKGGNLLDSAASLTGKERIAFLIRDLQNYSTQEKDDNNAIDIDIVGFSRGAAQAREFANQIAANSKNGWYSYKDAEGKAYCQKVNFRFMGLFDTVLSTHSGSYSLSIPKEFAYVAHAVAMNEYRNLFPVVSIAQGQFSAAHTPGQTRIERGFVGSHSDIGGSFADGDLAKVALVWMVNQATAAGVTMKTNQLDTTIISDPVIHDKSSNLYASNGPAPTTFSEDRVIRFGDGSSPRQRKSLVGTGTGYEDTMPLITYSKKPAGNVAGTVDMKAYLQWLDQNRYGINMTIQ